MAENVFSDFEGEFGAVEKPPLIEAEPIILPSVDNDTAGKLLTEIQSLRKELEEYRNGISTKKS